MAGKHIASLLLKVFTVPVDELIDELQKVSPITAEFIASSYVDSCKTPGAVLFKTDKQKAIFMQSMIIAALSAHYEIMDNTPTHDEKVIQTIRHILTPSSN